DHEHEHGHDHEHSHEHAHPHDGACHHGHLDLSKLAPPKKRTKIQPFPPKLQLFQLDTSLIKVEDNVFTKLKGDNDVVVAFDPPIQQGIHRFSIAFANSYSCFHSIGIVDAAVNITKGYALGEDEKSAEYNNKNVFGQVYHKNKGVEGNEEYQDEQLITAEVNMDAKPRTLHFFVEGKEQPVYVSSLPASIRFAIHIYAEGASFTVVTLGKAPSASVKGVVGKKEVQW
ncbi:MAG: hypothetical protein EZS28_049829, partial [Streblomastix strix]